jgi:hypothetical protein
MWDRRFLSYFPPGILIQFLKPRFWTGRASSPLRLLLVIRYQPSPPHPPGLLILIG